MKKLLFLLCITVPVVATAQVVNFAKTLPVRSYSIGITPSYYIDAGSALLQDIGVEPGESEDMDIGLGDGGALAVGLSGGYAINYSLDLGARFIYVMNGAPQFGVDLQYLLHETRSSYFSVIGGLHHWKSFGFDLTGLYTFTPRYFLNFTVGLDMDLNLNPDPDNSFRSHFWLPVNVGFNVNDQTFLFAEYDLRLSSYAWGIVSVGVNFIIR